MVSLIQLLDDEKCFKVVQNSVGLMAWTARTATYRMWSNKARTTPRDSDSDIAV